MDSHLRLPLLLDGATATNLFPEGLPEGACPEAWILEHPEPFVSLQREFVAAGSQAVLAPTFGANRSALARFGLQAEVPTLNTRLAELSRRAVGEKILVGGDLSPTGLVPPPFGEVPFPEIVDCYREQATALAAAGVDFILCETMTAMWDARAAVLAARETGLPVFASMVINEEGESPAGMPFMPFLVTMQSLGAAAVGLNCFTAYESAAELLSVASHYSTVPFFAKPAAGFPGKILPPGQFSAACRKLFEAGASVLGGCCGATPAHIRAVSDSIRNATPREATTEEVQVASGDTQVYYLNEDLRPSEEIFCRFGMDEDFIELENQLVNAALVRVESEADARLLAENAHMSRLPVMMKSDSPEALKAGLFYFPGRALVDSDCEIEEDLLRQLVGEYGAVLY